MQAAFRLHNFCIDERDTVVPVLNNFDPDQYHPNYEVYMADDEENQQGAKKRNLVREAITAQLQSDGRKRPRYNLDRNKRN